MNHEIAQELVAACERASAALSDAEAAIRRMPPGDERSQHLRVLSGLFADLFGQLRAPSIRQYPELLPAEPLPQISDTFLDPEDEEYVSLLAPQDLELIDEALLANCAPSWRKVARVVGSTMTSLRERLSEVPDGFYARRVIGLVENGKLESQGNLEHMRFSEIRLPSATSAV